jgi:hypothetical protein
MNLPETQLHSWQPRRPSARLKQRIFSSAARRLELATTFRWLVPATACTLLALGTLNQQIDLPRGTSSSQSLIAAIMNNQNPVSDLVSDQQSARNSLFALTLGWTNQSGSTSSISSFFPGRVN